MSIPPFTNEQQTVPVDRATLFPQSTRPVVDNDNDKLKQLDDLLKANFDVNVSHPPKRRKRPTSEQGQPTLHELLEPARKSGPICLYCDCMNLHITTRTSIQAYFCK